MTTVPPDRTKEKRPFHGLLTREGPLFVLIMVCQTTGTRMTSTKWTDTTPLRSSPQRVMDS